MPAGDNEEVGGAVKAGKTPANTSTSRFATEVRDADDQCSNPHSNAQYSFRH
jgi:hypothetical protein